jgi:hypothetical protein
MVLTGSDLLDIMKALTEVSKSGLVRVAGYERNK